jgi:uncharacterized protein YutE (UPF0331/DUF86 family)
MTRRRMARAAGFRSLLFDRYATVDDDRVMAFLDRIGDIDGFVQQVSVWMTGQHDAAEGG